MLQEHFLPRKEEERDGQDYHFGCEKGGKSPTETVACYP